MINRQINNTCDKAIVAFSKGDSNALSVIYDCMARMIFSVAYAVTGNYQDAEDVLQDTMIEITTYAHTYQSGTNAKAWILAMTRHLSIDVVRKKKAAFSADDSEIAETPVTEPGFSEIETLDMLRILDEEEKQLVIFRLYTELPYKQIAEIMKISVAAAQKQYQRAIKKLQSHYL